MRNGWKWVECHNLRKGTSELEDRHKFSVVSLTPNPSPNLSAHWVRRLGTGNTEGSSSTRFPFQARSITIRYVCLGLLKLKCGLDGRQVEPPNRHLTD